MRNATSDFVDAMKNEARKAQVNICQRSLQLYAQGHWRAAGYEHPPYVAFLALFVLAATRQGNFDQKAYYPRYWDLIGEDGEGTPNGFHGTAQLWKDLETWTVDDKKEELGRFKARIRGSWCYVGRPLSQTLLSDDERKALHDVFIDCGFDPTNIPSEDFIKSGLVRFGSKRLSHRTLTLLKSRESENEEFVKALLDLVITELEDSGEFSTNPPSTETVSGPPISEKDKQIQKEPPFYFRTCIRVNDWRETAEISLRLRTVRFDIPDYGFELRLDDRTLICYWAAPGWSTPLKQAPDGKALDISMLDWLKDWKFTISEGGREVTYWKSDVRLFLSGEEEDLPEYIESQKLLRNCKFYVLCNKPLASTISKWMEKSCKNYREMRYAGIPAGWTLFEGINPAESCQGIGVLSLSNLIRIRPEGGIRAGRGRVDYFSFAPPKIRVDGAQGNESLICNGNENEPLEKSSSNAWLLPKAAPVGTNLSIQIKQGAELLSDTLVIRLVEPLKSTKSAGLMPKRDFCGEVIKGEAVVDYVSGAFVSSPKHEPIESLSTLPTQLSNNLILVGQVVGQVARWSPSEQLPSIWTPVWIIYRTSMKKWATHFCRNNLVNVPEPIQDKECSDRDKHAWKEILWNRRKRIRPPEMPALAKLWTKYQEVARDV
jgi:hypothetical protein